MTKRSTFAQGAVALAAGAIALGAAASAAAQPYGQYGYNGSGQGYGYDPCRRESSGRSVVGALLGGAIGASVGANAAARNNRQDGALLGGAVGAIAGAAIGKNGAACNGQTGYAPQSNAYYNNGYSQYGYNTPYRTQPYSQYGYNTPYRARSYSQYGQSPYGYVQPGYGYEQDIYGDRRGVRTYGSAYADSSYAYGRGGQRYRLAQGGQVGPDGCTLAESPIHMPDGRVQTRFVRVCMDSSGRYQVVD